MSVVDADGDGLPRTSPEIPFESAPVARFVNALDRLVAFANNPAVAIPDANGGGILDMTETLNTNSGALLWDHTTGVLTAVVAGLLTATFEMDVPTLAADNTIMAAIIPEEAGWGAYSPLMTKAVWTEIANTGADPICTCTLVKYVDAGTHFDVRLFMTPGSTSPYGTVGYPFFSAQLLTLG